MLYEKLSKEELLMIEKYIRSYADIDAEGHFYSVDGMAPMNVILNPWRENKIDLFRMFGEQLILSKQVSFKKSPYELTNDCEKLVWNSDIKNGPAKEFYDKFREQLVFTDCKRNEETEENYWVSPAGIEEAVARRLGWFFTPYNLSTNIYDGEDFTIPNPKKDNKPFKVQKGCKVVKTLMKIAAMYDIPGAEEFRNLHSQVLNQKELNGELCISIHPMDYITMSDNDCDWESCMSWLRSGAFRQGTVEMMNSNCVVVAYLKSSNDMHVAGNHTWNNKKWRELYIVTPDLITNVKGYPYENDDLSKMVVDWLKELAVSNLQWRMSPNRYDFKGFEIKEDLKMQLWTATMYNDFSSGLFHAAYIGEHTHDWDRIEVNYSGPSECMWCGETGIHIDVESQLVCDTCEPFYTCDCCGDRISAYDYENNYVNGMHVCSYCLGERFLTDCCTGEGAWDDDCSRIDVEYNGKIYTDLNLWADVGSFSWEEVIEHIGNNENAKLWRVEVPIEHRWSPDGYYIKECIVIKFDDIHEDAFNCGDYYYSRFKDEIEDPESGINKWHCLADTFEGKAWEWHLLA